jgi:hypothetical protein
MSDASSARPAEHDLPEVVQRYQDAHDRHDDVVAVATFTPDATVVDDGQEYIGHDAILGWLAKTASEFTYTRSLLDVSALGSDSWVVTNRLEGNFPGSVVDLRYQFRISGDLISELVIAP